MNHFRVIIFFLLLFCFSFAEELTIMTENYPPYNYKENGELKGISVEIVEELLNKMKIAEEIHVLPWSRAYYNIQNYEKQILFSMARTKERETLFKWVGPIISYEVVFLKRKDNDLKIENFEDLKKVDFIGSGENTSTSIYLKKQGFTNLDLVAQASLNPVKLDRGRIDLWLTGDLSGYYRLKKAGVDPKKFESAFTLREETLYIAFSKDFSDKEILNWQKTFDKFKSSEKYQEIIEKYKN